MAYDHGDSYAPSGEALPERTEVERKCSTCAFGVWPHAEASAYECRANAPRASRTSNPFCNRWPVVLGEEWCGKWKAK